MGLRVRAARGKVALGMYGGTCGGVVMNCKLTCSSS